MTLVRGPFGSAPIARYVAVAPWQLHLRAAGFAGDVLIEDIGAGGLAYRSGQSLPDGEAFKLTLRGGAPIITRAGTMGPDDGPALRVLSATVADTVRSVLRFDSDQRSFLAALFDELALRGVLKERLRRRPSDQVLESPTVKELLHAVAEAQGLPADAERLVANWIVANASSISAADPSAWPLTVDTLRDTFRSYYFGAARFQTLLLDLLADVKREDGNTLHGVPMRMLAGLSDVFVSHEAVFRLTNVVWHPRLWDFLQQTAGSDEREGLSLIAIDTYVSEGVSRRQFLRLLAAHPMIAKRYSKVYLAAVVGHPDIREPYHHEGLALQGTEVWTKVAFTLGPEARSDALRSLAQRLDPNQPARSPSLVVFYYGAPFDAVSGYWTDSDNQTALFRPLEYYNPSYRPPARAPYFQAYRHTLEWLAGRADRGGVVLLHGPEGGGKTYLAARLAETRRPSNYIFWYRCRSFDSIENLIEHLDVFLIRLGIDDRLSSRLYRPDGEADVAERLVRHLGKLDRPAILMLDGLERVNVASDSRQDPRSVPFTLFVSHLVRVLSTGTAAVSPPFMLLTHSISPTDSGETLERLTKRLGIRAGQSAPCPIDEEDVFNDASAVSLARRLVRDRAAVERYEDQVSPLTNSRPYRTWLVAYWINRCMRQFGHQLNATVQSEIGKIVNAAQAGGFDGLDAFHQNLYRELKPEEQQVLEVAAAWNLPWSRIDLEEIMTMHFEYAPGIATTVINNLQEDRSPFIVALGAGDRNVSGTDDAGSRDAPFAPHLRHGGEPERFEMPSVAAAFFLKQLESRPYARAAYSGVAGALERRLDASTSKQAKGFLAEVFETTLTAERIVCLCHAGRPSEAAQLFSEHTQWKFKRLNAWDRVLQLGKVILNSASVAQDGAFREETRFDITAMHANALVEAFDLANARDTCERALMLTRKFPLWTSRFRLIEAKCLRYENSYVAAIEKIRPVADRLASLAKRRQDPQRQSAIVWAARANAAMAQCYMALGELGETDRVLGEMTRHTMALEAEPRRKLEGLQFRHRGTVHLLRGDLNAAADLFERFEIRADGAAHLTAIARYKRARVLLERVREWEPKLHWDAQAAASSSADHPSAADGVWGAVVPARPDVLQWLKDARALLDDAWNLLRQADQGDRKWFPAIELWKAYAELVSLRLGVAPETVDGAGLAVADGGKAIERIERRLPSKDFARPQARALEVQTLSDSHAWQSEMDRPTVPGHAAFVDPLLAAYRDEREISRRSSSAAAANAYKRSWREYERMHYLWCAARRFGPMEIGEPSATLELKNSIYEAAARAYRSGTSLLYGRGLARAAYGLHRLAVACFADRADCLQERLEAAVWLDTPKAPSGTIDRLMRQIAVEALRLDGSRAGEHDDRFFTVPTKVICRLLGADTAYFEVATSQAQPSKAIEIAPGRDPLVLERARGLALECHAWLRDRADWDRLLHETPGLTVGIEGPLTRVRASAAALQSWLRDFLVCPDTVVTSPRIEADASLDHTRERTRAPRRDRRVRRDRRRRAESSRG
jgi:hypothetical protein